jgi:hypothetical protein
MTAICLNVILSLTITAAVDIDRYKDKNYGDLISHFATACRNIIVCALVIMHSIWHLIVNDSRNLNARVVIVKYEGGKWWNDHN